MALVRGCHVIERGDLVAALEAVPKIIENGLQMRIPRGLSMGKGAWAYHIDMVPEENRTKPMVVFDVDAQYVERKNWGFLQDGRPYFTLRLGSSLELFSYVKIEILGFLNLLPPFPVYEGSIGFFSR